MRPSIAALTSLALLIVVLAAGLARGGRAAELAGNGNCGDFFDQRDAAVAQRLGPPPYSPALLRGAETVPSGKDKWECIYTAYGYPKGRQSKKFVNSNLKVHFDQLGGSKKSPKNNAKKICASGLNEACKLAEELINAPIAERPSLIHRLLDELGAVRDFRSQFGGNTAFIWEPDAVWGAGSWFYVFFVDRKRVLSVQCTDAGTPAAFADNNRDPDCAKSAAKSAYLGLL